MLVLGGFRACSSLVRRPRGAPSEPGNYHPAEDPGAVSRNGRRRRTIRQDVPPSRRARAPGHQLTMAGRRPRHSSRQLGYYDAGDLWRPDLADARTQALDAFKAVTVSWLFTALVICWWEQPAAQGGSEFTPSHATFEPVSGTSAVCGVGRTAAQSPSGAHGDHGARRRAKPAP
jgi:hypothetical protein